MTRKSALGLLVALQVTLAVLGSHPVRPAFSLPPAVPTLAEPKRPDLRPSSEHEEPAKVPTIHRQPGIL